MVSLVAEFVTRNCRRAYSSADKEAVMRSQWSIGLEPKYWLAVGQQRVHLARAEGSNLAGLDLDGGQATIRGASTTDGQLGRVSPIDTK